MRKRPVTVLSSSLGAGKPPLLDHVLDKRHELRVGVDDMNEVSIDAAQVRDGGASLSRTNERLVEMTTAAGAARCATTSSPKRLDASPKGPRACKPGGRGERPDPFPNWSRQAA